VDVEVVHNNGRGKAKGHIVSQRIELDTKWRGLLQEARSEAIEEVEDRRSDDKPEGSLVGVVLQRKDNGGASGQKICQSQHIWHGKQPYFHIVTHLHCCFYVACTRRKQAQIFCKDTKKFYLCVNL
jgi:hypothetical protein